MPYPWGIIQVAKQLSKPATLAIMGAVLLSSALACGTMAERNETITVIAAGVPKYLGEDADYGVVSEQRYSFSTREVARLWHDLLAVSREITSDPGGFCSRE